METTLKQSPHTLFQCKAMPTLMICKAARRRGAGGGGVNGLVQCGECGPFRHGRSLQLTAAEWRAGGP